MLPPVSCCAEPVTQLRTVNVKLTLKSKGIYPSILCLLHIIRTL